MKPVRTLLNRPRHDIAGLYRWNVVLAALHGLQALAVLLLASGKTFPVTAAYMQIDRLTSGQGGPVLVPVMQQVADLPLAYLVAGFFVLPALAHASMAFWGRARYETDLKQGINRFRWIEYGASASLMLVVVALLAGVTDRGLLLAVFAFGAVAHLCGLLMETQNANRKPRGNIRWGAFWLGCLAGLVPWVIILGYLLNWQTLGASVPVFVWVVFGSLFLLCNAFAVNMVLQYRQAGRWKNHLFGERAYMVLSLLAKTALAWQVFAGSLRP